MKIAVCVKAVPSTTKVRLDPDTHTLIRDGRQSVLNPCDGAALEEALCIREALGGTVTAISMGIPDTRRLLADCISRGADAGILLSDRAFAGADTLATAYALSCCLKKTEGLSLVLCGKAAVDGDTAQIGPELAGSLGIPCLTNVIRILQADADRITVQQEQDGEVLTAETPLPAVITVVKSIRNLRMPSISGIRRSGSIPVQVMDAAAVGADRDRCGLSGSATRVVRTFVPESGKQVEMLTGTASELAAQLAELIGGIE